MTARQTSILVFVLFVAATIAALGAWLMSAEWLGVDPGNWAAWLAAAVTFAAAGFAVGNYPRRTP